MNYCIQVCWSDGTIYHEESFDGDSDECAKSKAISVFFDDPTMEGDYVRVITSDGELVYHSMLDL